MSNDVSPRHRRPRGRASVRRPRGAQAAIPRRPLFSVRPVLRVLVLLALSAAVAALVLSPRFDLSDITVDGNHHLGRAEVIRLAALERHPNVFLVSSDEVAAGLASDPYVRAVDVNASLPGSLHITIREWQPVAVLSYPARGSESPRVLVNSRGTVLGPASSTLAADMPALLVSDTSPGTSPPRPGAHAMDGRLLDDLGRMHAAFVSAYHVGITDFLLDPDRNLTADTTGPRILFGQMATQEQIDSLTRKLASLAALSRTVDLARSGLDYVDLRNPDAPATHAPSPSPAASPLRPLGTPRPRPSVQPSPTAH